MELIGSQFLSLGQVQRLAGFYDQGLVRCRALGLVGLYVLGLVGFHSQRLVRF